MFMYLRRAFRPAGTVWMLDFTNISLRDKHWKTLLRLFKHMRPLPLAFNRRWWHLFINSDKKYSLLWGNTSYVFLKIIYIKKIFFPETNITLSRILFANMNIISFLIGFWNAVEHELHISMTYTYVSLPCPVYDGFIHFTYAVTNCSLFRLISN